MTRIFEGQSTCVVALGASDWSKSALLSAPVFRHSSDDFLDYVVSELCVPFSRILCLFDSPLNATDQLERISEFVSRAQGEGVKDVLFHYVGHGLFSEENEYMLLIRSSRTDDFDSTAIRFKSLAKKIRSMRLRRFLILDCCFSGASNHDLDIEGLSYQSDLGTIAATQMQRDLPARGTLTLCSTCDRKPSKFDPQERHTAFSGALLAALQGEHSVRSGDLISFEDLRESIDEHLRTAARKLPRPQLHCPDQSEGRLDRLPAFSRRVVPQRQNDGDEAPTQEGEIERLKIQVEEKDTELLRLQREVGSIVGVVEEFAKREAELVHANKNLAKELQLSKANGAIQDQPPTPPTATTNSFGAQTSKPSDATSLDFSATLFGPSATKRKRIYRKRTLSKDKIIEGARSFISDHWPAMLLPPAMIAIIIFLMGHSIGLFN